MDAATSWTSGRASASRMAARLGVLRGDRSVTVAVSWAGGTRCCTLLREGGSRHRRNQHERKHEKLSDSAHQRSSIEVNATVVKQSRYR